MDTFNTTWNRILSISVHVQRSDYSAAFKDGKIYFIGVKTLLSYTVAQKSNRSGIPADYLISLDLQMFEYSVIAT
ncbi:1839_t:CDS:2 [Ambispora leptoticha]|uniref:1839_t:CDS:1 n=1 Tax=Ambispora leptoticha TaxID=144679 RepID=A0A9N9AJS7_9GLOM|nr:1839_t:CDS:2 [Ambispora leptoticha]